MKKVLVIFLLLINIVFLSQNIINAARISDEPYIYHKFVCDYNLQYYRVNGWTYTYVDYVVYMDEDGKEHPAYCLNETSHGVGTWDGSLPGYNVTLTEVINDDRIWRVIINGYPYKSPTEIGVENEQDAFIATKYSVYCIVSNYNVRERYRGGTERGNKIVDAMERLVDIGRNGSQKRIDSKITVEEIEDFTINNLNPDYYEKEYRVKSNTKMTNYELIACEGVPEGSKIVDKDYLERNKFESIENFKILIPKDKLVKDFNIKFAVKGICQTYPVFYGKTSVDGYQNYAITADTYEDIISTQVLENHLFGYVNIKKVSADNNIWTGHLEGQGVQGATYEIKNEKNEVIKIARSNDEGNILVDYKLPVGKYTIAEIDGPEYFVIDPNVYEFEIAYNEHADIILQEEVQKCGYLNFIKMSSEDNLWNGFSKGSFLKDAVYELRDEKGKLLYELTTNANGTLNKHIKLKEGKYTIKEIKAPENYILDDTIYSFEILENEQKVNFTFYNKSVPKELKKLPRTGM